jgi:LPXTG-motif cell wall-anchored protein
MNPSTKQLTKEEIMKHNTNQPRLTHLIALSAVVFSIGVASAFAQDTTTTSIRHGEPTLETQVRNAEIVYVEGNDLVLKLESGKVEHLVVPSSEKFTIDGKEVTASDLKAGTKLTQTITTTTTPRYVNTVRTLKGKVWHVNAPGSVILSLPDGTNHLYKVPSHAKFTINGKEKTVFDLKKGMMLEATIVTDSPETVMELSKTNVGQVPAPTTPKLLGVLLIQKAPMPEQIASNVTAEHVDTLPDTGSPLPWVGLLGLLSLASSLGLGAVRKLAGIKA